MMCALKLCRSQVMNIFLRSHNIEESSMEELIEVYMQHTGKNDWSLTAHGNPTAAYNTTLIN